MRNIKMGVKDNTLTIVIDLSEDLGPSKSGKTILTATTGGNIVVGDKGHKIGINCYRPK